MTYTLHPLCRLLIGSNSGLVDVAGALRKNSSFAENFSEADYFFIFAGLLCRKNAALLLLVICHISSQNHAYTYLGGGKAGQFHNQKDKTHKVTHLLETSPPTLEQVQQADN